MGDRLGIHDVVDLFLLPVKCAGQAQGSGQKPAQSSPHTSPWPAQQCPASTQWPHYIVKTEKRKRTSRSRHGHNSYPIFNVDMPKCPWEPKLSELFSELGCQVDGLAPRWAQPKPFRPEIEHCPKICQSVQGKSGHGETLWDSLAWRQWVLQPGLTKLLF